MWWRVVRWGDIGDRKPENPMNNFPIDCDDHQQSVFSLSTQKTHTHADHSFEQHLHTLYKIYSLTTIKTGFECTTCICFINTTPFVWSVFGEWVSARIDRSFVWSVNRSFAGCSLGSTWSVCVREFCAGGDQQITNLYAHCVVVDRGFVRLTISFVARNVLFR